MTEQEWLTCAEPGAMLDFLEGKISDRQYRLFVVACCKRVWHLLDEITRHAVHMTERYALGQVNFVEVIVAAAQVSGPAVALNLACVPAAESTDSTYSTAAAQTAGFVALTVSVSHGRGENLPPGEDIRPDPAEQAWQCHLIRDLFGNPFRPVVIDPAWVADRNGAVVIMARGIQASGCFEDLPILADALEEVGCSDEAMLTHCRQGGEHVRGCWVVDAIVEAFRRTMIDAAITASAEPIARLGQLLEEVNERRRQEREALLTRLAWFGLAVLVLLGVLFWLLR
jgi:hypothetical protein